VERESYKRSMKRRLLRPADGEGGSRGAREDGMLNEMSTEVGSRL
jgi:hypothetical protein